MEAGDELEVGLLTRFMARAKEAGWLIIKSAKAEDDIVSHYHQKRNYFRAQVSTFL